MRSPEYEAALNELDAVIRRHWAALGPVWAGEYGEPERSESTVLEDWVIVTQWSDLDDSTRAASTVHSASYRINGVVGLLTIGTQLMLVQALPRG